MSRIFRSITNEENKVQIGIRSIKRDFATPIEGDELSIEDLYEQRDQLIQEAQAQIDQERELLQSERNVVYEELEQAKKAWEEEKKQLEQQVYEQGFQQGYEDGIQKATTNMVDSIQQANDAIRLAVEQGENYVQEQEYTILNLALSAAERILHSSLKENDELYLSLVKKGLQEAREMTDIRLYVPLYYYELVCENREELDAILPPDISIIIFVQEKLQEHEGYIETSHGRIVFSIDEQLSELRNRLSEMLISKE